MAEDEEQEYQLSESQVNGKPNRKQLKKTQLKI